MSEGRKQRDRIGITLYILYRLLVLASVVVIAKILWLQLFFRPNPRIASALTPPHKCKVLEPARGNILDCNGRILAISSPSFQIYMDCTVMKKHHEDMEDKAKGKAMEEKWLEDANRLSRELAKVFPGKSAERFYKEIREGRQRGKQYLMIGSPVDKETLDRIKKFPLFEQGQYKGGIIVKQVTARKYPYGGLARRTLGFIRDASSNVVNDKIGLEGKFDYILKGEAGHEWMRKCDYGLVRDFDSTYVQAIDGQDIRTTIDIDLQAVADRVLREQIEDEGELEAACFGLMEVKTGAMRVMVNLMRDPTSGGRFLEISNLLINRRGEPGSVFKTVTLAALLTDGHLKSLEQKIPTNHGIVSGTRIHQDDHITSFERRNHTSSISMYDGFKMSSNYVLATWAINCYGRNPQAFSDRLNSFCIGQRFDFDIVGLASPFIASPSNRKPWTNTDLGTVAYGYSTLFSPIYTLMFYNAIANKGRMMKPYLVEQIERDGVATEKRGPIILRDSIFNSAVADTLTRALMAVTSEGTATILRNARCAVAGKTGTARIAYDDRHYVDELGRYKNQGSFVGFFPADGEPLYSVICVVYSKLSHRSFYGGTIPARAVKAFIDELERTDPYFRKQL